MLSKSAARAFFVGGTVITTAVFIGLTVDTFLRIPAQTHAAEITDAVKRGKDSWDHNNCMGCHTIMGEGAYYAPELTKVYDRRGPEFIKAMLRDPEKMYPGQRRMRNYHFSDAEIDDLTAFLNWVGKVDLNGFPPKPTLAPADSSQGTPVADIGARPPVFNQICVACHTLHGKGGNVGPLLDGVANRRDAAFIDKWLHDPTSIKADSKMPKLPLTEGQIQDLVAFLSHQTK